MKKKYEDGKKYERQRWKSKLEDELKDNADGRSRQKIKIKDCEQENQNALGLVSYPSGLQFLFLLFSYEWKKILSKKKSDQKITATLCTLVQCESVLNHSVLMCMYAQQNKLSVNELKYTIELNT